ncbi:MAG: GntG family PLP-dependent aldolase [Bacteroidota bacterium]
MKIDMRSDTVTKPTPGMRAAMMDAEVGDDVFQQDPTVNALQEKAAALFGMEAALFCPSGTMTNQIAFKIITEPLSQVIMEDYAHPYRYEGGGLAFNSGVSVALVKGDRGRLTAAQIAPRINPDDVHFPRTMAVALENTCNRGGGACYDFAAIREIRTLCNEHGLALHLDGARLFNALAETPETPADYGAVCDTISICLSKGLGAPVGSLLLSSRDRIHQARRVRKVFGGGMRQAGFLAAAGIYALDHHRERLKEDHRRARLIEGMLQDQPYVAEVLPVATNIVVFRLVDGLAPVRFLEDLAAQGVLGVPFGGQLVRLVTHLDFTEEMLNPLSEALKSLQYTGVSAG